MSGMKMWVKELGTEWISGMNFILAVFPCNFYNRNAYHGLGKTENILGGVAGICFDQSSKFWGMYNCESYSSVSCVSHIIGYSF